MPALYDAHLVHVRTERMTRVFRHRVHLWLVDLDELATLPRWLRVFARFPARDHLGRPDRSIRDNLRAWLATQNVTPPSGRILMLANARVLGYVFNPLTVFWCHNPDGSLACVVAEVHNTYGERHCYLLRPDRYGWSEVDKALYVSPFFDLTGQYRMRLPPPDERLSLTVTLRREGRQAFTAVLTGRRHPATPAQVLRLAVTQPLMPHRVSALIHAHGIALWLRRLPITPRRPHIPQEGVS